MKLEVDMVVTVKLNNEELRFRIVHSDGDGEECLSLKAPLAKILGAIGIGDWIWWRADVPDGDLMRVELVKVEEEACS